MVSEFHDFRTSKLEPFHGFTKKEFGLIKSDWSKSLSLKLPARTALMNLPSSLQTVFLDNRTS